MTESPCYGSCARVVGAAVPGGDIVGQPQGKRIAHDRVGCCFAGDIGDGQREGHLLSGGDDTRIRALDDGENRSTAPVCEVVLLALRGVDSGVRSRRGVERGVCP